MRQRTEAPSNTSESQSVNPTELGELPSATDAPDGGTEAGSPGEEGIWEARQRQQVAGSPKTEISTVSATYTRRHGLTREQQGVQNGQEPHTAWHAQERENCEGAADSCPLTPPHQKGGEAPKR